MLPSVWAPGNVIAILNHDLESWLTKDGGLTWAKLDDTIFVAGCGVRDPFDPLNAWIGRAAAGANHIQYSPSEGAGWYEHSAGFTANAPVSSLQVTK